MWLPLLSIGNLYLSAICMVFGKACSLKWTLRRRHILRRNWSMCSKYTHYSRLHNYYNWEWSMWLCKEKPKLDFYLFQLLHLNFDFVIWNDNLCGSQLPTGCGNSQFDPTTKVGLWCSKVPKRRKVSPIQWEVEHDGNTLLKRPLGVGWCLLPIL